MRIITSLVLSYNKSEIHWGPELRGFVLSSFFYGYICTQLIGGVIGNKIGGVKLIGYGLLAAAALTLLTPAAARRSVYLVAALRTAEGVFEVRIHAPVRWALFLINVPCPGFIRVSCTRACSPCGRDGLRRTSPPGWCRSPYPAVSWAR